MGARGVRLNPRHQDSVREKIKASQIITRLTNHVLGTLGKPMEASQVTAALGLLKKCVPDLTSTELVGREDAPLLHEVRMVIVDPKE